MMILPAPRRIASQRLLDQLGVTRVARISGLDRTGVEVACAIRPGGHVLQVSNGKGATFEQAAAAAVSEAAELWAAERVSLHELRFSSFRGLSAAGVPCLWPSPEIGGDAFDLVIGWCRGALLANGREVWIPAQLVHCPPPGVMLGPAIFRWTTNGLAAHRSRDEAIRHALREVIERDQLAHALPHGFTKSAIRGRRLLPPRSLRPMIERLAARGFRAELLDLRPREGFGIPVGGAVLFDLEGGPIPMTAGYACAASFDEALERALLEAAQSRLTDIHGAREDVSAGSADDAATLQGWLSREPTQRAPPSSSRRSAQEEVAFSLRRLRKANLRDVAVVTLATTPLHVVRVVAPGLRLSELL